jgi:SAM-dependent methyltransferase
MPLTYTTGLGPLEKLKNNLAFRVRAGMFETFMRECRPGPGDRVADFGVSGHRDHPVHYFFEVLYPNTHKVTAIGRAAENARWFPEQFRGLRFLEADLRAIPLPDNYFAAGICNAVIEHAGSRQDQCALVREVCRVCERVMFTTPSKRFPIEIHTFLPFVHWLDEPQFRRTLRVLGFGRLASIEELNPMDARAFAGLFPPGRQTRVLSLGLPFLKTNLVAVSIADTDASASPIPMCSPAGADEQSFQPGR